MLNLLCAAALFAMAADDRCDNHFAVTEASTVKTVNWVNCKSMEMITVVENLIGGGDKGSMEGAVCPMLTIITPAHGKPMPLQGWRLTAPSQLKETVDRGECKSDWFIIFPVTRAYCHLVSTSAGGNVLDYGCERCPIVSASPIRVQVTTVIGF